MLTIGYNLPDVISATHLEHRYVCVCKYACLCFHVRKRQYTHYIHVHLQYKPPAVGKTRYAMSPGDSGVIKSK